MIRVLLISIGVLAVALVLSVSSCNGARDKLVLAEAGEKVLGASGEAAHDAQKILDQGRDRDLNITVTAEKNHDAILQAPGADAALDPGFVDAVNGSLCAYRATPGCDQLLGEHPAELPEAR